MKQNKIEESIFKILLKKELINQEEYNSALELLYKNKNQELKIS